jgi:hypothetical protein
MEAVDGLDLEEVGISSWSPDRQASLVSRPILHERNQFDELILVR